MTPAARRSEVDRSEEEGQNRPPPDERTPERGMHELAVLHTEAQLARRDADAAVLSAEAAIPAAPAAAPAEVSTDGEQRGSEFVPLCVAVVGGVREDAGAPLTGTSEVAIAATNDCTRIIVTPSDTATAPQPPAAAPPAPPALPPSKPPPPAAAPTPSSEPAGETEPSAAEDQMGGEEHGGLSPGGSFYDEATQRRISLTKEFTKLREDINITGDLDGAGEAELMAAAEQADPVASASESDDLSVSGASPTAAAQLRSILEGSEPA